VSVVLVCQLDAYSLVNQHEMKEIKRNSGERLVAGLNTFLEKTVKDCEYFVYNQRTFGNESLHSLNNCYYEKGSVVSFPVFVMKRQFAMLDWNEQMRKKALGEMDNDIQDWQIILLDRLRDALRG
jgi:hypothetical protein